MTPAEQVQSKILELKDALVSQHPMMPVLLRTIHTQLKEIPDIVTILSEDEIAMVTAGLEKHTGNVISDSISKGGKGKSIKSLTLDDL